MIVRIFALTVLIATVLPSVASATATVPQDIWNPGSSTDELNIYEIYNLLYGTPYTSSADLAGMVVAGDQVFNSGGIDLTITTRGRFAGAIETLGIYQPTGAPGGTLTDLLTVGTADFGLLAGPIVVINPVGDFGFYLRPGGPLANGNVFYSEEALNEGPAASNGGDHMILYETPFANRFLMVWADLPLDNSGVMPDDLDYNDLVVELTFGPANTVPEPATLSLVGLGLTGMLVRRKWRGKL